MKAIHFTFVITAWLTFNAYSQMTVDKLLTSHRKPGEPVRPRFSWQSLLRR